MSVKMERILFSTVRSSFLMGSPRNQLNHFSYPHRPNTEGNKVLGFRHSEGEDGLAPANRFAGQGLEAPQGQRRG